MTQYILYRKFWALCSRNLSCNSRKKAKYTMMHFEALLSAYWSVLAENRNDPIFLIPEVLGFVFTQPFMSQQKKRGKIHNDAFWSIVVRLLIIWNFVNCLLSASNSKPNLILLQHKRSISLICHRTKS